MRALGFFLVVVCVAGCDSLVDTDYPGEPLFRLKGVVVSSRGEIIISGDELSGRGGPAETGAKGAALWQAASQWGTADFTRLPMAIEFPAFWFGIIARPREDVLFAIDSGEPAIAEAYLHVVKPSAGAVARQDDFLATDYEHALVFVQDDMPSSGMTAAYLGAQLAPGFHVVTRTAVAEPSAPQQLLIDRCVAAAGSVPPDRARASCLVQHQYRLDPTADDLATVLRFRVELPAP